MSLRDPDKQCIRAALKILQGTIYDNNFKLGWRGADVNEPSFLETMALLHSEVSEAVEAWREHGLDDRTIQPERLTGFDGNPALSKPEGVGSEFADILIRLLDDCDLFGIDLAAEVFRKLEYNETRAFRHGGKRL